MSMRVIFAYGTPRLTFISMLNASTRGPSTTIAAPFAVDVWSACRLSTRRPHRLQRP
jgi:hypothetical protein